MADVAPHAGAWIETKLVDDTLNKIAVAPHAGAWIETADKFKSSPINDVAPHAGAWIETNSPTYASSNEASHPTRVRGLKRLSLLK